MTRHGSQELPPDGHLVNGRTTRAFSRIGSPFALGHRTMPSTTCLDAVALGLAAGSQPARAAACLKAACDSWPDLPLPDSLERLGLRGPGAVAHWRAEAARMLAWAGNLGCEPLWPAHAHYPPFLATIVDPPLLLWVVGDVRSLLGPAIAIVGSRRATIAGREVAYRLGADLAAAGVVVTSGFALGIDAAAHRGALSTGRSLAVLGCGVDQPYPREHADLAQQIGGAGALVSEFPPGMPPRSHHFPLRNRILSGLCHATVVVQAAARSGSLITAMLALEQGRDVMAVPGDVRSGANAGGHALLRDGARLVECAADVLDELGWAVGRARLPSTSLGTGPSGTPQHSDVTDHAGSAAHAGEGHLEACVPPGVLLSLLARGEGATLDDLLSETGRNSADLLGELLDLELAGLVRRDGGGRFMPFERKW